jgi:uncharacterized membrane protein YgaE (UPF0421/DUF939 family)
MVSKIQRYTDNRNRLYNKMNLLLRNRKLGLINGERAMKTCEDLEKHISFLTRLIDMEEVKEKQYELEREKEDR